jgi:hypothetical protein
MRKLMPLLAAAILGGCTSATIDETLGSGAGLVATGVIPCSRAAAQASCQFAVSRAGANSEVTVTWANGEKRVIFFENGTAVRADAAAVFTAERKGGVSIVRIGDERYEIPDASVSG